MDHVCMIIDFSACGDVDTHINYLLLYSTTLLFFNCAACMFHVAMHAHTTILKLEREFQY